MSDSPLQSGPRVLSEALPKYRIVTKAKSPLIVWENCIWRLLCIRQATWGVLWDYFGNTLGIRGVAREYFGNTWGGPGVLWEYFGSTWGGPGVLCDALGILWEYFGCPWGTLGILGVARV